MESKVKISLIISVYKNTDFLNLVFKSIRLQTFKDFEVIVAEDANTDMMKNFIKNQNKVNDFKIKHLFQEDKGFRKTKILNESIKNARGEYLVFIDGDCILHKRFLKEYAMRTKKDTCLFGRRVRLDKRTTEKLIRTKDFKFLSIFRLLFTKTKRIEAGIYFPLPTTIRKSGILGSNFCVSREIMYKINGFDEDFQKPTLGEDNDVEWRLKLIGIKMKCTKNKTVQYHLYHERKNRKKDSEYNKQIFKKKVEEGKWYCKNGINKKVSSC